jgi:alpha-galactosidase
MRWFIIVAFGYGVNGEHLLSSPPLGWMAWESYRTNVNEWLIRNTSDAMVKDGYLDAGFDTVHIDDGWMLKTRDDNGKFIADPAKFPSGMLALANYVHANGMKLGIYSAASKETCAGE